jgi:dipeptidyl aminopeptidase/acylaminoacyl peptidase
MKFLGYFVSALVFALPASSHAQMQPAGPQKDNVVAQETKASSNLKDIPVESFATLPLISSAKISPDGSMIAGLLGINGEQRIAAFNIVGEKKGGINVPVPDRLEVNWLKWINDDNIIVGVSALLPVQGNEWDISRVLAINIKTQAVTKLLWDSEGQNAGDLLWTPSDGSNDVLIAAQDSIYSSDDKFWPSVYRVNISNGKKSKVVFGTKGVSEWSVDAAGNVRAGIGYNDYSQTNSLHYRQSGSGSFKIIERAKLKQNENLRVPFMFIPGTDNGYVFHDNAKGQTSLYELDISTGKDVRTVFEPKEGEVSGALVSYDGSKLLGVATTANSNNIIWLDPEMANLQKNFDKAVVNGNARIISFNRDQSKMLVRINRSDNPGSIYYYDTSQGQLNLISQINDKIGSKSLSPVKMIKYTARDGLGIEGVLTLPKGKEAKNLPFIVLPHGGPWGQDTLDYDYWSQFLASRGYAVLQPNFRGSTGYGTEFLNKGKGQMGFAMQDDVTDGAKWAVDQGIADPKRMCIVGASYGGYAAMWGVVKDPDIYRCSISIAGVAALRREVNDFGGSTRENLFQRQWKEMTPDFDAVSPIKFVDKIKVPLLLIHGKKDITVKHVQSEKMYGAMKKAGKVVEFVSVPLADHYFTREADRITLLSAMEAFLKKHNPAD